MQTRTIRNDGNSDGKNIEGKNMKTETAKQSGPCWNPSLPRLKLVMRLLKPPLNRFQTGVALDLTRLPPRIKTSLWPCYDFRQNCYDLDLKNHSVLPTLLRRYDLHDGSPLFLEVAPLNQKSKFKIQK